MTYALALALVFLGTFLASVAQCLLKYSAQKYSIGIKSYANPYVLGAYAILFSVTFINLFTLKFVPLYLLSIIEASSYIYVALFSLLVFKENIHLKQWLGLALILFGIVLATL